MAKSDDLRLMVKTAKLYYLEGLNQEAIAIRFRTSRPTVSRLLAQARESGLVSITIHEPQGQYPDLEGRLEKRFNLTEAIVVESGESEAETLKDIGRGAADFLGRTVRSGDRIGVSWGRTIREVVNALQGTRPVQVTVFPLVGGVGQIDPEIHSNQLAIDLAKAFGGGFHLFHAPAVVGSRQLKEAIVSDPNTGEILKRARSVNLAIVGIGAPIQSSTIVQTGYFRIEEVSAIKACRAVGDICSQFYDPDGRKCDLEINERTIGIDLNELRDLGTVVGVAGGLDKVSSILGALRGGYVDVLVTDKRTAEQVLEGDG